MITFLKNTRNIQPDIDEIFYIVNEQGQMLKIICVDNPDDTCRGCVFENLCENSEHNKTQYACAENDRLDGKNVMFKNIN